MPTSEAFAPFSVVVVPFPYADRLAEKRRPALVVSSPALRTTGVIWVAMITTAGRAGWPGDAPIDDLAGAGLPHASIIRTAKLATIDSARIIRKLGEIDEATRHSVSAALRSFFATHD